MRVMDVPSQNDSQAFKAYKAQRYFASLDGLRFCCIALVFWLHSPAYTFGGEVPRFLTRGHTGVDFFFVLSGFLITTLLVREEERTGRISLRGFYVRRALRILPAYLLLVAGLCVFTIVIQGQTQYIAKIPYYLFFVANMLKENIPLLSIAWSLAVEEQFYLLWPLTLVVLSTYKPIRIWLLVALIIYCLVGGEGFYHTLGFSPIETEQAEWVVHFRGFSAILIGALMGLILNSARGFEFLWLLVGARWAPIVAGFLLIFLFQVLPQTLAGWPYSLLHVVMAMIVASLVIRENHYARRFMTFSVIKRIGQISYGIYLYHLIGLHIATKLGASLFGLSRLTEPWSLTVGMIVVSIFIAEISFRFYEQYFLQERWQKR